MSDNNDPSLIEMTVEIVAAYVSANELASVELPNLIGMVHTSLANLQEGGQIVVSKDLVPAVPFKKSVFPDHIVCLEDGKRFKSLKRHLRAAYDMSPDDYRSKWGLAPDYPMVARNYAAARSELAKKIGLGRGRR
ncbi:MucR family transcriptional regulator [Candidatus Phycosocius spiralis]|uniref:MucR family transcriptional regulator n=1 Tax=Candidatus Phycosocius spiralis TaxID=2815099 RepID=A0ABQ4PTJ7_9PROT|nr:MucR family transcriptional regulator [Candidatus Phycosocius spiralis]GIU66347.1 MucR family transcriptional regulator [Candidatus Phycosocius spiralis]